MTYNTAMIDPLTQKSFIALCQQWTEVINRGESGIQMWPPVSGAHYRIKQFLADTDLQNRLFSKNKPQILFVDANEVTDYSYADFEKEIIQMLLPKERISLQSYLTFNQQRIAIFFTGLDTAIKKGNFDVLKYLGGLIQKYPQVSIILISELHISDEFLSQIAIKNPFVQNIFYAKIYNYEDSLQFFSYLEEKWQCNFDKKKTDILAEKIGGHLWLIKESARILRATPTFRVEEILDNLVLIKKGLILFSLLDKDDQKNVLNFLKDEDNLFSDYLQEVGIIDKNTVKIAYWYQIKKDLIRKFDTNQIGTVSSFDISLTALEREVFELLLDSKGIVTREDIAKTLWHGQWEDRYSDWAIDQMIHRLREKIELARVSYQIITKKGEGFVLTTK